MGKEVAITYNGLQICDGRKVNPPLIVKNTKDS
jgi:hypothetical protein